MSDLSLVFAAKKKKRKMRNPVRTLDGEEDYLDWSKKMKKVLISEGLWHSVQEGYQKPKTRKGLSPVEMKEMKQEMVNDVKALSLIHQSLSPPIFMRICYAKTAKEAWDTLQSIFLTDTKKNQALHLSKDGASTHEHMNEPRSPQELEDESSDETVKWSDTEDNEGMIPLSGDKPFFDMLLMKSAVKPLCHMNFPTRVDSLLPKTNILANVRFCGKDYEVYFYGKRKQKSFGSGWRQLVVEHNLVEGDFTVFEVIESSDSKLVINLQLLKSTLPSQLEQEINRRKDHQTDEFFT